VRSIASGSPKGARPVAPRQLVDSVAEQIPGDHALYDVDFDRTVAFVHDTGNLYINDTERFDSGVVGPSEISEIKADIRAALESATDADGEVLLEVFDGDDLFPTDEESPDLVVSGRETYESRSTVANDVIGDTGVYDASHRSEGIVLCRGPSIDAGATLRGGAWSTSRRRCSTESANRSRKTPTDGCCSMRSPRKRARPQERSTARRSAGPTPTTRSTRTSTTSRTD